MSYAEYFESHIKANNAVVKRLATIRGDWERQVVFVDKLPEHKVLPYQRPGIPAGTKLHAIMIEATGEAAKAGEDPLGVVTVRHTYAYPAGE